MALQTQATQTARVNKLKGEILAHAEPMEVLGITGSQKDMAKNVGNTYIFRRWLPFGGVDNKWITGSNVSTFASNHATVEGVTPSADTLTATDITVVQAQYACLYAVTDQTVDMYEDNIPSEMKVQTGQRIGLVREMVRYGILKAATNVFYAGGTTPGTVDESISVNLIRKVTRSLKANHAKMITKILDAGPNFNTSSIEASYLVFCHTDMEAAIRDLPGFVTTANYARRKVIHENEIGSCENFRFILSPELAATIDTGAAVGTTGLYSTGASLIDIYPVIVAAEDAWGQLALKGKKSLDVSYIAPGQKDKSDPLGQRGYIGATTYFNATMLNQGWMAVVWCGTPDLA